MLGNRAIELELPAHPSIVGTARDATRELRGSLDAETFEAVQLVVSELVTNAIRHSGLAAGDTIRLRVAVRDHSVLAEVSDTGSGFRAPTPPTPRGIAGGFGLFLVDRLADRWGVATEDGTLVWAELHR